jgi:hypothetical protein
MLSSISTYIVCTNDQRLDQTSSRSARAWPSYTSRTTASRGKHRYHTSSMFEITYLEYYYLSELLINTKHRYRVDLHMSLYKRLEHLANIQVCELHVPLPLSTILSCIYTIASTRTLLHERLMLDAATSITFTKSLWNLLATQL